MKTKSILTCLLLAAASLLISACGGSDDADQEVGDITEILEDYYATFKRVPPEWKEEVARGEITEQELEARMENVPMFFRFQSPGDLPNDLTWIDGSELDDLGSPQATKGGTNYTAIQDFPRTLRTVGPDSNGSFRPMLLDDVTMPLADRHPNDISVDENGHKLFPGVAKEWAVDWDNKIVYARLFPDATWSDGQPLTADDFLFMFYFYQSTYIQAPWYNNQYTEVYTGITKYDDHTIAIHMDRDKPDMPTRALSIRPIPRHFYNNFGEDFVQRYQWEFQPTTGPYVIHERDIRRGRSITLTRNEDWWARDKKFWGNRFNYDRIQISVIRDTSNMFESFRRGDLDKTGLVNLPENWYERLPNTDSDVANGYITKIEFYNEVPRPTYGLWLNQAQPLLNNRDIRLGINHATNWQRVIDEYFRGDYERMNTSADGYGDFSHPTLRAREYDVDKALDYFAKAGFTRRGSDGILINERGNRLSFAITTGYRQLEDLLVILREEAARAGVEFRLDVLDSTSGWKKVQEKNHEISFTAFGVAPEMYPRYWETYHSLNAYDNAWLEDGRTANPERTVRTQSNNLQSLADPDLDAMIMAYRRSNDVEEMKRLSFAMEEFLHEDASFIPGWIQPFYRTAHWRWIRYPDDFNLKLSRSAGEYFLDWIDLELKEKVQQARRNGIPMEPERIVYDQYSIQMDSDATN